MNFLGSKKNKSSNTTVIAASMRLEGELNSDNSIAIYGEVVGHVSVAGDSLLIAQGAEVKGDVSASDIEINGTVKGAVTADFVSIGGGAIVNGPITAARITVANGAEIQGKIHVSPDTIG